MAERLYPLKPNVYARRAFGHFVERLRTRCIDVLRKHNVYFAFKLVEPPDDSKPLDQVPVEKVFAMHPEQVGSVFDAFYADVKTWPEWDDFSEDVHQRQQLEHQLALTQERLENATTTAKNWEANYRFYEDRYEWLIDYLKIKGYDVLEAQAHLLKRAKEKRDQQNPKGD